MRRIGIAERRTRLALRHHLAPIARSDSVVEVAGDLVGLHATDPASVYLAAAARMRSAGVAAVEHALYEQRSLVRMLGMRRTMFVVPVAVMPVVQLACTRPIAVRERRRLEAQIEQSGLAGDGGAWLRKVEQETLRALEARGEATAAELAEDVPGLRERMRVGIGTKWEAVQGVSTRVLFVLSAEGHLVRGRPRGSWTSSQYRWAPMGQWLGSVVQTPQDPQAALIRRWLRTFGPGTVADLKWWTGWTLGEVRRTLEAVRPVEVQLEGGGPGLVLDEDGVDEPAEDVAPQPWVALLPALDPTVMGWAERGWFLGAHAPRLFDRSGNPGPTVWLDGRVVGGWAQRRDGEIVFRLLEDVGSSATAAVEAAAARLGEWLGGARVTPRFRTPLERELTA